MNTRAIDNIIAELSARDFNAAWTKYPDSFKAYHNGLISRKPRGFYSFSYTPGSDTREAIETKKNYIAGTISEEEYKAYCLKYNLLTV